MTDSFRTTPPEQQWSGSSSNANGQQAASGNAFDTDTDDNETGKALLIGVLGGLLSAAGYLVYRRLPDDQKERIHAQVRTLVASRINDLRQTFNL
jgi:hypothetical protein